MIWNLITRRIATLWEIENVYTVDDIIRANTAIDIENAIQNVMMDNDNDS